jgi:cytochrome c
MKQLWFALVAATLMGAASAYAADSLARGDPEAGAIVFKKCMACHKVGPDAKSGMGPVLNGIVGRPAGTYPGYKYSAANKNSGLIWDEATLTAYLRSPNEVVPNTTMKFPGLKKDEEIQDVIAYLRQFDADGHQTSTD